MRRTRLHSPLQAHELCRRGFTFSVLHSVFAVHPGIKERESAGVRRLISRTVQSGELRRTVRAFRARLDRTFPRTRTLCPPFAPEVQ